MKVFISWSGDQSLAVAQALWKFLPDIIQNVDPWMSAESLTAGARWTPKISEQLEETKFGIICLTPTNQAASWLLFEAGALAKTLKDTVVVPYLTNIEPSEVVGPLAQFQSIRRDKKGTWELVKSINKALSEKPLEDARLRRLFERTWPELADAFETIPEPESSPEEQRSEKDILREVLELTRDLSRRHRSNVALINNLLQGGRFTTMSRESDGMYYETDVQYSPPYYPNVMSQEEVEDKAQEDLDYETRKEQAREEDERPF